MMLSALNVRYKFLSKVEASMVAMIWRHKCIDFQKQSPDEVVECIQTFAKKVFP